MAESDANAHAPHCGIMRGRHEDFKLERQACMKPSTFLKLRPVSAPKALGQSKLLR